MTEATDAPSRQDPVRTVILGTRGHADRVAIPTVQTSSYAVFSGLVGSDFERTSRQAAQHEVKPFRSLKEVAGSGEVEAVWLTAPNNLHVGLAVECLRLGLNVLVEKPMAISISEGERLREADEHSPATLRVAYQHRFRPAHRALKDLVDSGHLGAPGAIRIHRYWRYPYYEAQKSTGLSKWRRSAGESGGWCINDILTHSLDLLLWVWGGDAIALLDCLFTRQYRNISNDSSVFMTLKVLEHGIAHLESSNVLESPGSYLEVYGAQGWARLTHSFDEQEATLCTHDGTQQSFKTSHADSYLAMFDDFLFACRNADSYGATAADGLANVALVEAATRQGRFLEDVESSNLVDS